MRQARYDVAPGSGQGASPRASDLLERIRTIVGALDLDCACRGKLDAALERFASLETRRAARALILDARHQAERIAALLELVRELDTITTDETDLSAFEEIALLFDDIKLAAERGAADMVSAASLERRAVGRR